MKAWESFFQVEQQKEYYQKLMHFLEEEYRTKTIYPPKEELFTCFHACSYEAIKVVILGQDPYHQPNQAHGLCFSVKKGVRLPPSLRNIYKEIKTDIQIDMPTHGYLMDWAVQGVFMMNAILSVEHGKAGSHSHKGWEIFSDHVMEQLNTHEEGIVFLLWGNWAKKKAVCITNPRHKILIAPHPSPFSAHQGFFGSRPFSQINAYLVATRRDPICWKIEE